MFREIKPQEIKDNPFELIGKEWLLVAANKDGKSNAMTASWGAVGEMWGKSVVMIVIRPHSATRRPFWIRQRRFPLVFSRKHSGRC